MNVEQHGSSGKLLLQLRQPRAKAFAGELMDRAAKPAYNKVKVRALKLLKDMLMANEYGVIIGTGCRSPTCFLADFWQEDGRFRRKVKYSCRKSLFVRHYSCSRAA